MRIEASLGPAATAERKTKDVLERRFTLEGYAQAQRNSNAVWEEKGGNRMQDFAVVETGDHRSEAAKIYDAAVSGGGNPLENLRQSSKVPYGYLAKDGVITYNGVTFFCDERTNSICLGDTSNRKEVLNIPLSGGGQLKVNRKNLGDLAKAIDMFSPEDINRIMRAIAQDTKIQSMQNEMEEMESSLGKSLTESENGEEESQE